MRPFSARAKQEDVEKAPPEEMTSEREQQIPSLAVRQPISVWIYVRECSLYALSGSNAA